MTLSHSSTTTRIKYNDQYQQQGENSESKKKMAGYGSGHVNSWVDRLQEGHHHLLRKSFDQKLCIFPGRGGCISNSPRTCHKTLDGHRLFVEIVWTTCGNIRHVSTAFTLEYLCKNQSWPYKRCTQVSTPSTRNSNRKWNGRLQPLHFLWKTYDLTDKELNLYLSISIARIYLHKLYINCII